MPFRLAVQDACGFCRYVSGEAEFALVVEVPLVLAFVNHRQYEHGAMLVIPKAHRPTILEIEDAELAAVHLLARRLVRAAQRAWGAVGANVYQNNGLMAGQHVPHLHVHVVPRYENSNSDKLFLEREHGIVTMERLQAVAAAVRSAL